MMSGEKEKKAAVTKPKSEKAAIAAKRDFTICHNEHLIQIKAGDDVSTVPGMFHENLKTEGVI